MMSTEAYAAKAAEMDAKADECFSVEAADSFRMMAGEWRNLQAEALAQTAWVAKNLGPLKATI